MHHAPDATRFFPAFRARFAGADPLEAIRAGLIGQGALVSGPFGEKPILYADYVASGRALRQVEEAILEEVLPYYANSHTEASFCGAYVTALRRAARAEVARLCGAGPDGAVIFGGSGATAGLNRLVHLFGVRAAVAEGRGATVLHGPYEHHSNLLPWRESGAKVVEIPEADCGGPDLAALEAALAEARRDRPDGLVVGAFSAASNVTGILTDVAEVTRRLKAAGALAVWDYAGGGPYLPMTLDPAPDAAADALVFSPHKFVGGPAASGVLIVRRTSVRATTPTFPGGGTVRYVSASAHDYLDGISDREEAGTPNVIGDIRAALALVVKDAVGEARIAALDHDLATRMMARLAAVPRLRVLGNRTCARLPIFSLLVEGTHPQLATRLMSDLYGIQMRGGCACAGPYGHALLGIDAAHSEALRARILAGDAVDKPGFVRFNLSYLTTEAELTRIAEALAALPEAVDRHASAYRYEPASGTFRAA